MSCAVEDLFNDGFALCRLTPADALLLEATIAAARSFFHYDETVKRQQVYFPRSHVGYRFSGIEYSETKDRPDLNDSLSISTGWRQIVTEQSRSIQFYTVAERLLEALDQMSQDMIGGIASRYGKGVAPPRTSNHSWLQVNHYRPFAGGRHVLQDKHEDGHILTLWHSQRPGLEVFTKSARSGVPITVDENHMLVMPGGLLELLTSGDIAALHHRVVQAPGVSDRISLMYFVNPATERRLSAFGAQAHGQVVDVAAIGARNPLRFGLPQLPGLEDR